MFNLLIIHKKYLKFFNTGKCVLSLVFSHISCLISIYLNAQIHFFNESLKFALS